MKSFKPFPFLQNPHFQTILGAYFWNVDNPLSKTEHVPLPDGDVLAIEISTPPNWQESSPTILMVHGLGGSHESPYLKRLAHKCMAHNIRAVRINLRGCGTGQGLSHKAYHAGVSFDIFEVIEYLKKQSPNSPMTLVGFSLGGNIVLKLAGEKSDLGIHLEKVIGVCPSVSLEDTSLRFHKWPNRFYERKFLKFLKNIVSCESQLFSKNLKETLFSCSSLYEFDDQFTAPFWGYKSAKDYYTQCSSKPLIPNIKLPCHILFAGDDPLIDANALNDTKLPSNIELKITKHGGHMGFLGHPKQSSFRWMDDQIFNWAIAPN